MERIEECASWSTSQWTEYIVACWEEAEVEFEALYASFPPLNGWEKFLAMREGQRALLFPRGGLLSRLAEVADYSLVRVVASFSSGARLALERLPLRWQMLDHLERRADPISWISQVQEHTKREAKRRRGH